MTISGVPGQTDATFTQEYSLFAIGPDNNHLQFHQKGVIDDSVTDAGNTNYTSTLRGGKVLAKKTSDGKYYAYDADADDGTQIPHGILGEAVKMTNKYGVAEDKLARIFSAGILSSVDNLVGSDYFALATLIRLGLRPAQAEPHGSAFGFYPKGRSFKATDYTVTVANHGMQFTATAAANFTLPALADVSRGWWAYFVNAADTTMVVTGAANTIVYGDAGGAYSTTLTFSTANKKMGGAVLIMADYVSDGGSLLWFPMFIQSTVTSA